MALASGKMFLNGLKTFSTIENRQWSLMVSPLIVSLFHQVFHKDPSVNDLSEQVKSKVRPFADDTAMYLAISSLSEASILQDDLRVPDKRGYQG